MKKYLKEYKWSNIFAMLRNQKLEPAVCTDDFHDRLVVITGATSGIGSVAARKYASHGADILSINRNESKSQEFCETLRTQFGVKCDYLLADFSILADIHAASAGGAQEIVLTGVHLGSWGHDFFPKKNLRQLVEIILGESDVQRLRLSSLEPWDLDDNFFDLWRDKRLARHLHLPLQSGSSATLKRMARKTTPNSFATLIDSARSQIPDVAITTDVIAGFPGETEAEFHENIEFVRQMNFAGGHVFTYSARPGTTAAKMPDQVHHATRKMRNAALRSVIEKSSEDYRTKFLGDQVSVLWETAAYLDDDLWKVGGLTDNYIRVFARTHQQIWNQITPVQLTGVIDGGMVGNIISENEILK